jgi:TfoX/Sxy family transcriptional regulator of competence genes
MTKPRSLSPDARYAELCAAFFSRGDANPSEKKGFGSSALSVDGRIFAMLVSGRLVVKLPKARVDALVDAGWGERFDANKGRPMKEWLAIDPAHDTGWESLAREALMFVKRP